MKLKSLILCILAICLVACNQNVPPPEPYGAVPGERQLKWHELEILGMVNFSTITFYGKEWGYGDEDPAKFNPTDFDALQIVRAAKAGGLKGLIIDAKHHGCIGARRLWRGHPITSEKIRLRIIKASASPALSEFAVYLEPESSRKEADLL